jgi:2-keto-4-pentenoate hydratase/2-oxohepta-3-ene-1,7-dioic acid hydratase in catechol pathway
VRFQAFKSEGRVGLGILNSAGELRGELEGSSAYPGGLLELLGQGGDAVRKAGEALAKGQVFDTSRIEVLPPVSAPPKIICIGLNYIDHAHEGGFQRPEYPAVFGRFQTSLIGHNAPLIRPHVSDKFDYEGELVAVIGKGGRYISMDKALDHVAGYSIFNDGSVRDYQLRTTQWTLGKNFDGTGSFGPTFVTADELPRGATGLRLQTRLNGQVVQDATTADLIFDIATLVSQMSEAFTLEPGDIIVTGTPSGIGHARKPPLYMKPGDVCEVEIEGLGILSNPIADES